MRMKEEQGKMRETFKDKMYDLVDDENERDELLEGFDDKMRQLDKIMKNES